MVAELANHFRNLIDLRIHHRGMQWQRENSSSKLLDNRERRFGSTRVRWRFVNRNRVVDCRGDTVRREVRAQRVAIVALHHKLMEDMISAGTWRPEHGYGGVPQRFDQRGAEAATVVVPRVKPAQLNPEDRGLKCI